MIGEDEVTEKNYLHIPSIYKLYTPEWEMAKNGKAMGKETYDGDGLRCKKI